MAVKSIDFVEKCDAYGVTISQSRTSGEQTSPVSTAITSRDSVLVGVVVSTDGTNDVTVNIYAGSDATGTKLIPQITIAGADRLGGIVGLRVHADDGIYLVMSGTGGRCVVYYA